MFELKCGLQYKVVKQRDYRDFDPDFLDHLLYAQTNGDPLSSNYTINAIERMIEYGYVFDGTPDNLVFMVGLQDFGMNAARIESRLFVHPDYRRGYWRSPDNYEVVLKQINTNIETCDFLFKSREALNPAGFKISARLHPYFRDWKVHFEQIELKYPNNWQWIMYKTLRGKASDHVKNLVYQV